MVRIALDFGTTNTVVAVWNSTKARAETLNLPGLCVEYETGVFVIPSVLYVESATPLKYYVGAQVASRGISKRGKLFSEFKKKMVMTGKEIYPPVIDGEEFSSRRVSELYLNRVLSEVRSTVGEVDEIAVTVPIQAYERYRDWLRGFVSEFFPYAKVRCIDESTAAAIGYGETHASSVIAVVDIGGGTMDISIIHTPEFTSGDECAIVAGKDGATLGGADIDNWILQHIRDKLDIPQQVFDDNRYLLQREAERVKIRLSKQDSVSFSFFDAEEFRTYECVITRYEMETLMAQKRFYIRMCGAIRSCIEKAEREKGVTSSEIERVIMVGGSANIPSVADRVRECFPSNEVCLDRPYDAVVCGALNFMLGYNLIDHILRSYAIHGVGQNGVHVFKCIFRANTDYPSKKVTLPMQASVFGQEVLHIKVAEMRSTKSGEVLFSSGGMQVGLENVDEYELMNDAYPAIVRLDPPANPGQPRINAEFYIDENKTLKLSAYDLLRKAYILRNYTLVKVE